MAVLDTVTCHNQCLAFLDSANLHVRVHTLQREYNSMQSSNSAGKPFDVLLLSVQRAMPALRDLSYLKLVRAYFVPRLNPVLERHIEQKCCVGHHQQLICVEENQAADSGARAGPRRACVLAGIQLCQRRIPATARIKRGFGLALSRAQGRAPLLCARLDAGLTCQGRKGCPCCPLL